MMTIKEYEKSYGLFNQCRLIEQIDDFMEVYQTKIASQMSRIKVLEEALKRTGDAGQKALAEVNTSINSHWIPVSERLPNWDETDMYEGNVWGCKDGVVSLYGDNMLTRLGAEYWMPYNDGMPMAPTTSKQD